MDTGKAIISAGLGVGALALLVMPAWADLLDDRTGGFEDPWPSDPPWQGHIERDSAIWGPPAPVMGDHFGSVQQGGGATDRYAYLAGLGVAPGTTATLTGYVAGGTMQYAADLYVQLLDGPDEVSPVAAEWRLSIPPITYGFDWTPFEISGAVINSGNIVLKFGFVRGPSWCLGTAIHVDCLTLTPEPASMALFTLAALPLLMPRRT